MKTNLLKSRWSLLFTFAFILSLHLGVSKAFAADSSVISVDPPKSISVTGNGEVTVTPDIVYLYLGVLTEKSTTIEAQNSNTTAINNVIAAIKKEGLKDEDIKTNDYSIYPKYDYDKNTETSILVGYRVSYTLKVTVKDISNAGKIIDNAVAAGANISNSISFGISDYEKYYNQALLNALSNAQSKAQTISGFLSIKLSAPLKVIENSSGLYEDSPITLNGKFDSNSSTAYTSIQAGTYKVKANVSLVYQY